MVQAFGTSRRAHFSFAATVTLALLSTLLSQPSSALEPAAAAPVLQQSGLVAGVAEEVGLVRELATATSNTYREGDGSLRLESFTEPVNYLNEDEAWVPIDNELIPAPGAAYEAMNAGNSFEAKIPADPSTTPVSFATEDAWVTMRMHGLDDAPILDGEVATFADVAGADEVTYEVTNTGLKEDIRLDAAPSASGSLKYTYSIDASAGITPVMGLEGSIEFRDSAGEAAVVMPAAYMFDSATPESATSHDVTYDLTTAGAGWKLTVTPSMQWLQDPARVYPVTIDPTLGNAPASKDCWIRDTTPTTTACGDTATYVKVGRSSGPVNYRGLLDFDTSSIPTTATVTDAAVALYLDHTQSTSAVTGDYAFFRAGGAFSGSSATWNSSGASGAWVGGDPGGTAYGTVSLNGSASGFRTFGGNLTDLVQGWVTSPGNKTGLVLKQGTTPTLNVLSFYSSAPAASNDNKRPRMNVTYTVAPSTPIVTVGPCVQVCSASLPVVNSLTPAFSGKSTDADTATLQYSFQVRDSDTLALQTGGAVTGASGATVAWQAPAGYLNDSDEQGYDFRVGASDGTATTWTAWAPFILRVAAADPVLAPAMTAYGVDENLLADLSDYAADEGKTVQSVVDLYGWQSEFNAGVDAMEAAYPGTFSRAEMNPSGLPGALVEFKGANPPPGASAFLSDLPVVPDIEGGATYSSVEIQGLSEVGHQAVVDQTGNGSIVTSKFDHESDLLRATVYAPSSSVTKSGYETAARAGIEQELPSIEVPGVAVEVVSEPPAHLETFRGGSKIGWFNNFDCTAAFVAKVNSQNEWGLLTARHCSNDYHWYAAETRQQRSDLGDATLFASTSEGDVQYHPLDVSEESPSKTFYWKRKKHRLLVGADRPQKGNLACLFGQTSGGWLDGRRTCSYIRDLGESYTEKDENGNVEWEFHNLVQTVRDVSLSGDSGGPWFLGSQALGVHSGSGSFLWDDYSFFAPISAINSMGLVLNIP